MLLLVHKQNFEKHRTSIKFVIPQLFPQNFISKNKIRLYPIVNFENNVFVTLTMSKSEGHIYVYRGA